MQTMVSSIWREAPVFSFDWVLTTLNDLLDSFSRAYYITFNPIRDWLPGVLEEKPIFADWLNDMIINNIINGNDPSFDLTLWEFITPMLSLLVAIAFLLYIIKLGR